MSPIGIIGFRRAIDLVGASIAIDSPVAGYEATFLRSPRQAAKTRSTDLATCDIVTDCGQPVPIGALTLYGGNWTTAAVLTWAANDTDSWGSPAVSGAILSHPGRIHMLLPRVYQYRYWRVRIVDAANPAGYLELGMCDWWLTVELQEPPTLTSLSEGISDVSPRVVMSHGDAVSRAVPTALELTVAEWTGLRRAHALELWRHLRDLASGSPVFLAPEAGTGLYSRAVYGSMRAAPTLKPADPAWTTWTLGGMVVEADREAASA